MPKNAPTVRQLEIYWLWCAGSSQADIAKKLQISQPAVSKHLKTLRQINPQLFITSCKKNKKI
jgi:predicted transcriptional regulator